MSWLSRAIVIDWMRQLCYEFRLQRNVHLPLNLDLPHCSCHLRYLSRKDQPHSKIFTAGDRRNHPLHSFQVIGVPMQGVPRVRILHQQLLHGPGHPLTINKNHKGNAYNNSVFEIQAQPSYFLRPGQQDHEPMGRLPHAERIRSPSSSVRHGQ